MITVEAFLTQHLSEKQEEGEGEKVVVAVSSTDFRNS